MSDCIHGQRIFREGDGPKAHWQAWFCPTPKGTQDQCKPEWVKQTQQSTSTGQTEASGWSNGVPPVFATKEDHYLEQIKGIRVALERLSNIMESYVNR